MDGEIYKIKDNNTGLFSNGGCRPGFTKKGKIWKRWQDVKAHLKLAKKYYHGRQLTIEVYEYRKIHDMSVDDQIAKIEEQEFRKIALEKIEREQRDRQQRYEQYQKLKKEFEE